MFVNVVFAFVFAFFVFVNVVFAFVFSYFVFVNVVFAFFVFVVFAFVAHHPSGGCGSPWKEWVTLGGTPPLLPEELSSSPTVRHAGRGNTDPSLSSVTRLTFP